MTILPARDAVELVGTALAGFPATIAGSAASAAFAPAGSATARAFTDVDVFNSTTESMIAAVPMLQMEGFDLDEKSQRIFNRWLSLGVDRFHTNSIKLWHTGYELEVNLVRKQFKGQVAQSAAAVIESFDYGLLHHAYDCRLTTWRDMSGYLFPGMDPHGPLPMMPERRESTRQGLISQYQALRSAVRYAKYHGYGYDMSLVRDDLVTGYALLIDRTVDKVKVYPENEKLIPIYTAIHDAFVRDDVETLASLQSVLVMKDDLDRIYEALNSTGF